MFRRIEPNTSVTDAIRIDSLHLIADCHGHYEKYCFEHLCDRNTLLLSIVTAHFSGMAVEGFALSLHLMAAVVHSHNGAPTSSNQINSNFLKQKKTQ